MTNLREILEAAEALRALGLVVFVEINEGLLLVFRDDEMIGRIQFPVDDDGG